MSSLSKDLNISNNQSPTKAEIKSQSDLNASKNTSNPPSVSRKKMINDIQDYKNDISERSNFKRGSAYTMTNLFLKLCNLNFTIANLRSMSDEELFAIWSDIKSSK